jgi:hypothetical protein
LYRLPEMAKERVLGFVQMPGKRFAGRTRFEVAGDDLGNAIG